jgi:hypothetical protein
MPDGRILPAIKDMHVCLVAAIQNKLDHAHLAEPCSIMEGCKTAFRAQSWVLSTGWRGVAPGAWARSSNHVTTCKWPWQAATRSGRQSSRMSLSRSGPGKQTGKQPHTGWQAAVTAPGIVSTRSWTTSRLPLMAARWIGNQTRCPVGEVVVLSASTGQQPGIVFVRRGGRNALHDSILHAAVNLAWTYCLVCTGALY